MQAHLGSLAVKPEPAPMLRGATRLPGRYYDAYLEGFPPRPIARRTDVARYAGSTQTGSLVAESLKSVGLVDTMFSYLSAPWLVGAGHRPRPTTIPGGELKFTYSIDRPAHRVRGELHGRP